MFKFKRDIRTKAWEMEWFEVKVEYLLLAETQLRPVETLCSPWRNDYFTSRKAKLLCPNQIGHWMFMAVLWQM